jgi:hypothetical protein
MAGKTDKYWIHKAKQLYTAYCRGVGGVAYNGDALPTAEVFFADESKQKQVNAWLLVAKRASK